MSVYDARLTFGGPHNQYTRDQKCIRKYTTVHQVSVLHRVLAFVLIPNEIAPWCMMHY